MGPSLNNDQCFHTIIFNNMQFDSGHKYCQLFQKILLHWLGNIVFKIVTDSHYWLCESSQSLSLHDVALHKATHLGTLSLLAESGYDDTLYVRNYILNFYLIAAS